MFYKHLLLYIMTLFPVELLLYIYIYTGNSLSTLLPTQKQLKLLCCNISFYIAEVSTWLSTASLMKPIEAETVDCLRSFSIYIIYELIEYFTAPANTHYTFQIAINVGLNES